MKRVRTKRLRTLQRQQSQLLEVEKELRKMISNVNESLNVLKVEELQLKSYAVSCCVGPDGQNVAPLVFSQQWERSDKEDSVSNYKTLPASSSTSDSINTNSSICATNSSKTDPSNLLSFTSENHINKQEINLETSFRSSFPFLNNQSEEEEEEEEEDDTDEDKDDEDDKDEEEDEENNEYDQDL